MFHNSTFGPFPYTGTYCFTPTWYAGSSLAAAPATAGAEPGDPSASMV